MKTHEHLIEAVKNLVLSLNKKRSHLLCWQNKPHEWKKFGGFKNLSGGQRRLIFLIFMILPPGMAVSENAGSGIENIEINYVLQGADASLGLGVFVNNNTIENVRVNESFAGGELILSRVFDDGVEVIYKNNKTTGVIFIKTGQNVSDVLGLIHAQRNTSTYQQVVETVELKNE